MKHRDELVDMLRSWAEENAADSAHAGGLAQRICERLRTIRICGFSAASSSRLWRIRSTWALIGAVAASLAFVLFGSLPGEAPARPAGASADVVAADAFPSPMALPVLDEVCRQFPGRLRWVSETDRQFTVELDPAPGAGDGGDTHFFSVQIVTVVRDDDADRWRTAWHSNVALRSEELATVRVPGAGNLCLWAYRVDTGLTAIDSMLDIQSPQVATRTQRIVRDAETVLLLEVKTDSGQTRVYQTVTAARPERTHT